MTSVRFTYKDGKRAALTMSYDDGRVDDRRLIEIFNKHGIKGTFHLNSFRYLREGSENIPADEVKTLYEGHEVSCHTLNHPFLERIAPAEVVHELCEDKRILESLCGYPVRGMSYPFGTYSTQVIDILKNLGMNYSRTVRSTGGIGVPDNFMTWDPSCHHNDSRLLGLLDKLKTTYYDMPLLYVWGHSYEFTTNNNWELMEEFCEKAGGDPNIWYATNIELFDYITAVRRCEMSYERDMIYNPSAVTVFVKACGKIIPCPGGVITKLS